MERSKLKIYYGIFHLGDQPIQAITKNRHYGDHKKNMPKSNRAGPGFNTKKHAQVHKFGAGFAGQNELFRARFEFFGTQTRIFSDPVGSGQRPG